MPLPCAYFLLPLHFHRSADWDVIWFGIDSVFDLDLFVCFWSLLRCHLEDYFHQPMMFWRDGGLGELLYELGVGCNEEVEQVE